jgi:AmmeMemoRadiSam system protein B
MNYIKPKNLNIIEEKYINFKNVDKIENIRGVIVPHSELKLAGEISNRIFERINFDKYDRVIILSTHHENNTFISESTEFNYKKTLFKFNNSGITNVVRNDKVFNDEYTWLLILPFLIKVNKINNITILLVGKYYNDNLFEDIKKIIDANTLVIANTNLIKCGKDYDVCPINHHEINQKTIENIQMLNSDKLSGYAFDLLSGLGSIKLFIQLAKHFNWVSNLSYYTSSDIVIENNDKKSKFKNNVKGVVGAMNKLTFNSIGYPGIIFTNALPFFENINNLAIIPRKVLMNKNVQEKLGSNISEFELNELFNLVNKELNFINEYDKKFGIFITIKDDKNMLRGCLGDFELSSKIEYNIAFHTLKSLFLDTRFYDNMITPEEEVKFSISFLNESIQYYPSLKSKDLDKVKYDESSIFNHIKDIFKIGLHGITIFFTYSNGTYLSSVITDIFKYPKGNNLTIEMFNKIVLSLRQKLNSLQEQIRKIHIFECKDIDELMIGGKIYDIKYTNN